MRALLVVAGVFCGAVGLPACIIDNRAPHEPDLGDLAFNWSWGGETSCAAANVDNVDVTITDDTGEVVQSDFAEPCTGAGLIFRDVFRGVYTVDVTGYDHNGVAIFDGEFSIRVKGGEQNDAGTVELDPLGDPPPPPAAEGTLSFFWAFLYPTDDTVVEDCALAGVDSVDVTVTPQGTQGEPFTETSACDDQHQGLDISHLNEGRYTLRLVAHGSFDDADVTLYDSNDIVVDVVGDQTTDLGNIDMGRVADSFSDFNVGWSFADGSDCADGQQVTLAFTRDGFSTPETTVTVACSAASQVERTFVPGHYTVTGRSDAYSASVGVDLAPNAVADVTLSLAP